MEILLISSQKFKILLYILFLNLQAKSLYYILLGFFLKKKKDKSQTEMNVQMHTPHKFFFICKKKLLILLIQEEKNHILHLRVKSYEPIDM